MNPNHHLLTHGLYDMAESNVDPDLIYVALSRAEVSVVIEALISTGKVELARELTEILRNMNQDPGIHWAH